MMTNRKTHDPISPRGYAALRQYVEEAILHDRDPLHNPPPCLDLPLIEPVHGPVTAVALANLDGEPQVSVSFHGRNPRFFDPLDYAALALALAFGMGMCLGPDGKGRTYPRLRVSRPTGRALHLLRILIDAGPGEVARQDPAIDYHRLARKHLFKVPVKQVWGEGKPSRPPLLGRGAFFKAVERYWTLHSAKAGIGVPLADHLRLIRSALEIGDRRDTQRHTDTAGNDKTP